MYYRRSKKKKQRRTISDCGLLQSGNELCMPGRLFHNDYTGLRVLKNYTHYSTKVLFLKNERTDESETQRSSSAQMIICAQHEHKITKIVSITQKRYNNHYKVFRLQSASTVVVQHDCSTVTPGDAVNHPLQYS